MYCKSCGKEMEDDSSFCPECGVASKCQQQNNNAPRYWTQEKSAGIAIVLGFFFMGLGHLYAGKLTRGIVLMLANILLAILVYVVVFTVLLSTDFIYNVDGLAGVLVAIIGVGLAEFILWIWQLYDVNKLVKEYNEHARRTGEALW